MVDPGLRLQWRSCECESVCVRGHQREKVPLLMPLVETPTQIHKYTNTITKKQTQKRT